MNSHNKIPFIDELLNDEVLEDSIESNSRTEREIGGPGWR